MAATIRASQSNPVIWRFRFGGVPLGHLEQDGFQLLLDFLSDGIFRQTVNLHIIHKSIVVGGIFQPNGIVDIFHNFGP